jgi:hypothetical protein
MNHRDSSVGQKICHLGLGPSPAFPLRFVRLPK